MRHFRVYWLGCVLFLAAVAASATTIILPTDDQLIAKSPVIVEATVVTSTPVDRNGKIWTETKLDVAQALKGNVSGELIVREIGGAIDNRITKIFGAPVYVPGERVLAFLTPTPRGDYQTMDLYIGKFTEKQTLSGDRIWQRDDANADVALLDSDFKPVRARNLQRRADAFERYVAARVTNRPATADYAIENPVLQQGGGGWPKSGGFSIQDNFTLISEPTIYRWFDFEQGKSVNWYSNGSQPGYTGGGVTEISEAMGAWTGYSGALIRYNYAGASSQQLQPLNNNDGINGVLFNDPWQEIAGSYNPATGGVVGVGGFNGISAGTLQWTATFTADSTHVAGTHQAYGITEAGLTIQDGVTPSAGISSSLLAQIVAHEFGHTLGFGHSTDSTALMYPTVNGGGPTLRSDDQLAARWLYPNGSGSPPPPTPTPTPTPTVPPAPSNLFASASGTSVGLQWTDNAGGSESGESIYYATTTGSFIKIGNVSAGATSVTLTGFSDGTYRFYVTSFNSAGESSPSNIATATVSTTVATPATAAFTVSPSSGVAGSTPFTFIDQSTGTVTSRAWDFGDGTTSAAVNPTHVYQAAGQYVVTLTINGTSQASHGVSVANPAPVVPPVQAAFDWTPSGPTTASTVQFMDHSTGSPYAWSWSFGDGATSSQQNPQHQYAAAGTYIATLTATNSVSSGTMTHTVVVAPLAPYRALVSATAQTNGVGGSVWRTQLTILNAGSDAAYGQLILLPGAGGTMQTRPLYLAPRQSVTYDNALLDIFGMSTGVGAIAIEANSAVSTPNLKVTSRTFTTDANGGTYGQSVPEVSSSDLATTLYVTGMESDNAYRTNVGVVNRSDAAVGASLTLFDSNGNVLGTTSTTVPANNFSQGSLASYFPAVTGQQLAGLSMRVDAAAAGAISTYASVIDNRTQDPVYIQGQPLENMPEHIIPAVGRAAGANGTFWRSDVTMYNPTSSTMAISVVYLAANSDNRVPLSHVVYIAPGHTIVFADVLQTLWGLSSGTGTFAIDSTTGQPILASRTYTTVSSGGTYGQQVDPLQSLRSDAWIPGLRSDAAFRSNVGFVNAAGGTIGVSLSLIDANGQTVATGFVQLQARSMTQGSVAGFFPGVDLASLGNFTLQAHTDSGAVLAVYGSIVDNTSGDPVFYAGQ